MSDITTPHIPTDPHDIEIIVGAVADGLDKSGGWVLALLFVYCAYKVLLALIHRRGTFCRRQSDNNDGDAAVGEE